MSGARLMLASALIWSVVSGWIELWFIIPIMLEPSDIGAILPVIGIWAQATGATAISRATMEYTGRIIGNSFSVIQNRYAPLRTRTRPLHGTRTAPKRPPQGPVAQLVRADRS